MGNNDFELECSESTYIYEFLGLATSKFDAKYCHKLVWNKYYNNAIDLYSARSLACKINSNQLSNERYLKNIYGKLGLAAAGIDLFVDCLKIAKKAIERRRLFTRAQIVEKVWQNRFDRGKMWKAIQRVPQTGGAPGWLFVFSYGKKL